MRQPEEDNEINLSIKFFNTLEKDDEKIAKEYYESRGYTVLKTDNKKVLKKAFHELDIKNIDAKKTGIPDFIVYNRDSLNIYHYFFVEAKSGNYSLKQNQIEWLIKYKDEKVIIFWLRKPNYNIYLGEMSRV
jgi:hypothetical protein